MCKVAVGGSFFVPVHVQNDVFLCTGSCVKKGVRCIAHTHTHTLVDSGRFEEGKKVEGWMIMNDDDDDDTFCSVDCDFSLLIGLLFVSLFGGRGRA